MIRTYNARVSGTLDAAVDALEAYDRAGFIIEADPEWDSVRQTWLVRVRLTAMNEDHAALMLIDWAPDVTLDTLVEVL